MFEGSQHADGTVARADPQDQTLPAKDKLDPMWKIPT